MTYLFPDGGAWCKVASDLANLHVGALAFPMLNILGCSCWWSVGKEREGNTMEWDEEVNK